MGRKRIKVEVKKNNRNVENFSEKLIEDDGLYPFLPTFEWFDNDGNLNFGTFVAEGYASKVTKNCIENGKWRGGTLFVSYFSQEYSCAITYFARSIRTVCIEERKTMQPFRDLRLSVGTFLSYCADAGIEVSVEQPITYSIICKYRDFVKGVKSDSRYKAKIFRHLGLVVERLMGTPLIPKHFEYPVYRSDKPDTLPPYSDEVMHQLIAACISDIDLIMKSAQETDQRLRECEKDDLGFSVNEIKVLKSIYETTPRYSKEYFKTLTPYKFKLSGRLTHYIQKDSSVAKVLDLQPILPDLTRANDQYHQGDVMTRLLATINTIAPFLLLFLIYSGRNLETVLSWQRSYDVGGRSIPPTEWLDPLSPNKCKIRGWKRRGRGKGTIKTDDVHIKVADSGLYPVLKFLLWYTEIPADRCESQRLFCCFDLQNDPKEVKATTTLYRKAVNRFLNRHQISELVLDEGTGEVIYKVLEGIDTRRFRKVYAAKELLNAMGDSKNHQELTNRLSDSLRHGSFDTTLGSYLNHDDSAGPRDVAIFALQSSLLNAAKSFKGQVVTNNDSGKSYGDAIFAKCADPGSPDYAYAEQGGHCKQYDMCLGCSKSRVFKEHLPRIATRIIQYEDHKENMTGEAWQADYGDHHTIALDALEKWENREEVEEAWELAKSGLILIPAIMSGGASL